MKNSLLKLSILSLGALAIGSVSAGEPNVPTPAPYIVLSENFDEPNGYGFCLDTFGPGQSELMHTHTCKPKKGKGTYQAKDKDKTKDKAKGRSKFGGGDDVRFEYDAETKQISSYAYKGQCMQVLIARGKSEFALLECSDHIHQKFFYEVKDNTLKLDKDHRYCVAVEPKTIKAGPWVKRTLELVECNKVEPALKQWTIVAK